MTTPTTPGPAGEFDIQALFAQAQAISQQASQAQDSLAEARVEGTAAGGLVRATVDGSGELLDLVIAPEALVDADAETLADAVLAAVRDGARQARALQQDQLSALGPLRGLFGVADEDEQGPPHV